MGLLVFLSGCAGPHIEDYAGTRPDLDLRQYFTGPIKAWGIVQNYRGRVTRRFDVDMVGTWDGDTGTLEEDFSFYDGATQRRTWTITRLADGRYEGRADDVPDKASGRAAGAAMRWAYQIDLPVGERTFRVRFDDWMYRMNDGVLINRSYLKKFGLTVAELTLFMQKQPE